jgi:hypothetical protein
MKLIFIFMWLCLLASCVGYKGGYPTFEPPDQKLDESLYLIPIKKYEF